MYSVKVGHVTFTFNYIFESYFLQILFYLITLPHLESKEPTNYSQVINIKLSWFRYESK